MRCPLIWEAVANRSIGDIPVVSAPKRRLAVEILTGKAPADRMFDPGKEA